MKTLATLINTHGVDVHTHLDRQVTVPVSAGLQRQGDVIVIPASMAGPTGDSAATPVGRAGVPVVRGESGGNTHLLLAEGDVRFDAINDGSLAIGVLTVAEGATGFLAHPEHGYAGIAPGSYVIRRQREQRDVIEMVAD